MACQNLAISALACVALQAPPVGSSEVPPGRELGNNDVGNRGAGI